MENIFDTLRDGLSQEGIYPQSEESRKWLRDKVARIGSSIDRESLVRNEPLTPTNRPAPGKMYMFFYDPKGSQRLPYYDKFPLVILVDMHIDGFEGLNLHYLPIDLRQKLFYSLLTTARGSHLDITYNILKSSRKFKAYKPCYKRYLTNHIKGNIVNVPTSEWENAVHLPTAMFAKQSETKVHADSREIVEKF